MVKTWKHGGRQDQFIEKLFNEGKISCNITGSVLKSRFATTFKGFSEDLIEKRLKILKRILTINYKRGRSDITPRTHPGTYPPRPPPVHDHSLSPDKRSRSDITPRTHPGTYPPRPSPVHDHSNSSRQTQTQICDKAKTQETIPIICETYKDPDTEMDMVLVAVALTGGVQDVKFELDENGTSLTLKYSWPQTLYTMDDLFKREMNTENLPLCHPKVLAMRNGVRKYRQRSNDIPQTKIQIDLPIEVRNVVKISGISRDDGTKILKAELVGCENSSSQGDPESTE